MGIIQSLLQVIDKTNSSRVLPYRAKQHTGKPQRANYQAARNEYEVQRRVRETQKQVQIETAGEDGQFRGNQRAQMIGLIRSAFRCSALPRSLILQRRLNIVGAVGGKLQLATTDKEWNRTAAAYFKQWAKNCDFTDGKCLNETLQLILTAIDLGGDCVVVHDAWTPDGGVLCGSNKIRVFEADEIGDLPESDFQARFPDCTQRHGKIYDRFGRFVGITVSASQRGEPIFKPEAAITLLRDPDAPAADCHWVYLQESFRANQGRGVSTFAASVDLIDNFGAILSSETDAAKLNATMFGAYTRTGDASNETGTDLDDYVFEDSGEDTSAGSDSFAVNGSVQSSDPDGTLPDGVAEFPDVHARSRGVRFDVLPDGYKMEIANTTRPNNNVNEFLRSLSGFVASTFGLNQTYVTLEPQSSYTAFRGAQLLARPSFQTVQKTLERTFCDWIAIRVLRDAIQFGLLPASEEYATSLVWTWPKQEEVDAVKEQQALTLKLKNGILSVKDLYGDDWESRVAQMGEERRAFEREGLIYPATETVSGQVTEKKDEANEEQN